MSLALSGSGQRATFDNTGTGIISGFPFTFAAWVYLDRIPANQSDAAICLAHDDNYGWARLICESGDTKADSKVTSSGSTYQSAAEPQDVAQSTWTFIAARFDSATSYSAFVGTNKTTASVLDESVPISSCDLIVVGALEESGSIFNEFDGQIAHVGFWSSALTDGQLSNLAGGALLDTENSGTLEAYYKFASGALTTDSSGNGRTLTLTGSPSAGGSDPDVGSSQSPVPIILSMDPFNGGAAL